MRGCIPKSFLRTEKDQNVFYRFVDSNKSEAIIRLLNIVESIVSKSDYYFALALSYELRKRCSNFHFPLCKTRLARKRIYTYWFFLKRGVLENIGVARRAQWPRPLKCLAYPIILCFEKRCPKQKTVAQLKSKILVPPKNSGLATPLLESQFYLSKVPFLSRDPRRWTSVDNSQIVQDVLVS